MSLTRRRTLAAVVVALLAVLALLRAVPTDAARGLPGVVELKEAQQESLELTEPADALLARQLFGSGDTVPTDVFAAAADDAAALPAVGARWELTGPTNIGGRVLDIAVDPTLPDTLYIATATGGVWKSSDAGTTFEPAWPDDLTQAIGTVAITPDGTLFAGTGETGPGGGSMTYGGTGVYRSTDRGASWELVGLPESSRISRIVVSPHDPKTIFAAASGPLFTPGGQRGLYRSTDGGDTWERVLKGDNATTGATDVAIDPKNPKRLFAAMWDHIREPDIRRYNGIGSGLYVSNDGGSTWQRTAVGLLGPNPAMGRIGVAIAPSNPNVIYVTASGESGAHAGFYKSTDGGVTWLPIAHPIVVQNNVVYGWWFGRVWVDPNNADHVFQAGIGLAESTDGGITWDTDGGLLERDPHADQHALAYDPKVPNRVYLGNDGGLYRSDDNAVGWTFAEYQPFSQLYGLDVSEQDPRRQVAGLQDNGVNRSYNANGSEVGADRWNSYGGGDGERTLINPQNENIVYGCSQYGECFRSDTGGGNPKDNFTKEVVSERKNWFTPIEFDPVNPATIYTGGELLNRSDDHGRTWRVISPVLSNGRGRETNPLFRNFGTLT
ncbi:MAG: glycoside hydrolase, partial [Actinomycetota bacterium]|nr:glycoside hydrolase [Actinomycetota bacterium]